MEIPCSSEISSVVVHARGALVTRRITPESNLPEGSEADIDLVVPRITPLADGGSLRASLKGPGRSVVSVRSNVVVPEAHSRLGSRLEQLQELDLQLERLGGETSLLQTRRQQLASLSLDPGVILSGNHREGLESRFADAQVFGQLVADLVGQLDERLVLLADKTTQLKRDRDAAALAHEQATSQERFGAAHPTRTVMVRISGAGPLGELELTYAVPAARWWPLYTLRLSDAGQKAQLVLEALVAQRSGEDWGAVPLAFSTADLILDAQLPELPSLRLGRAQPPPRAAYRPPPVGLERLFDGYDRAFAQLDQQLTFKETPVSGTEAGEFSKRGEKYDGEDGSRHYDAVMSADASPKKPMGPGYNAPATSSTTVPASPVPQPSRGMPAPAGIPFPQSQEMGRMVMAPKARGGNILGSVAGAAAAVVAAPAMAAVAAANAVRNRATGEEKKRAVGGRAYGGVHGGDETESYAATDSDMLMESGGGATAKLAISIEPEPEPIEPGQAYLDFASLDLAPPSNRSRRGRLVPARDPVSGQRSEARNLVEALTPSVATRDPMVSRGNFDSRYEARSRTEVPSDGQFHRITLGTADGSPKVRYRTVPRDEPSVYREAELINPFELPLLAGPVEVYVEGSLLTTSSLERVDKGGPLTVGMGVEERVRVARNARVEEETTGLLGGSTAVTHVITVDLTSSMAAPAQVELVDRIPVTDDKTVEVKLLSSSPEAELYKQEERGKPVRGGLRWRMTLAPGEKKKIEFRYRISFNARDELVGGNRRD
jgi:hypothetical protein